MGVQGFLKATKGDPDWAFTPDQYFDKQFKIIEASTLELGADKAESIILRQSPTERELLAKQIKIDVLDGASLNVILINDSPESLQQVFIYDISVHGGGQFNFGLFVKGGRLNKHILNVTLDNYATFSTYGHIFNKIGGDCEVIVNTHHMGALSNSSVYYTTESGEDSQTVMQAVTRIHEEGQYSQANIEVSNLITGINGKCHSVPEIFNNSDSARINCGTCTDYLDHERVYYLRTRGLSKDRAEKYLVSNHRNQTFNTIMNEEIKDEILNSFD